MLGPVTYQARNKNNVLLEMERPSPQALEKT